MRTIASVGCSIFGSGTSSTLTSRLPWKVSAFMEAFRCDSFSGGHSEGHLGAIPAFGDPLGGRPLLGEDFLRRRDNALVAGPRRDPLQQFVGGDLQMLEGEGETGQLGGRVGLGTEEGGEVEAAPLEHGV